MGPDRWVLIGEIFPLSVRGIGSSFGSAANWLGNFIVSQFFLVLLDAFGNNVGGPFAISFVTCHSNICSYSQKSHVYSEKIGSANCKQIHKYRT